MSKRLEAAGVDLIELSGGTYESSGFEHKTQSNIARGACLPSTHGRTAARQVKCSRRQRRMNGKAAYRPSRGGAPSQTCSMEYDVGKRESIKLRGGERTFDRSPWNSELDGP